MQIRSFTAESLGEALTQVKAALGEDAIILGSRRPDSLEGLPAGHRYEVTAALPAAPSPRPASPRRIKSWSPPKVDRQGRAVEEAAPAALPVEAAEPAAGSDGGWLHLKQDLLAVRRELKDITRVMRHGEHAGWPQDGDHWLRLLTGRGVPRSLACSLLDELPATEGTEGQRRQALVRILARRLPCLPKPQPNGRAPLVQAFVGPTGVGKTSAIAKLMLNPAGYGGRSVGWLSLDTQRIAAVEQTRRLASLARLRVEFAYRLSDLPRALDRLSGVEVLLIDTPGAGNAERIGRERIAAFLRELRPAHLHLVLAAGMRSSDQLAACRIWQAQGADRLLVTKLDETDALGGLLEVADASGLPFGFAGISQRIPAGLVALEASTLAGWILDPSSLHAADERQP
jgi:flagellar biosynthesis protein FlhF